MREIKFRAWDKENKRWVKCAYPLTGGIEYETSIIGIQGDEDEDLLMPDDVEMVWYTGLKDKNGIEIYEGDILRDKNGFVGEVVWLQNPCQFVIGVNHEGDFRFHGDRFKLKNTEVIGNIYENKELVSP